ATWFAAIGHDAAMLARRALSSLPTTTTTNADEVTARREAARTALESARAPLWTSDEPGLQGDAHLVKRTVKVVEMR
ncbi:MAG TPA: hypothetical protein VNO21_12110, partial [Polyangiaceae bacterium]|nr:hypothetical protein [Polyangiaceae bacterium]